MNYNGRARIVERDECEDVMRLCRALHEENGIADMDDIKVRIMLARAFDRQGGILAGIGEKGKLEGLLYILLSNFWYTTKNHWEEIFLYVLPEFRKSRNAIELIKFAKWCADETPFPLFIGIMPNASSHRKVNLYDRQLHSDKIAEDDLLYAKGMLEALAMVEANTGLSNVRKLAEDKRDEAQKRIKESTTQKGYFFIYKSKAA